MLRKLFFSSWTPAFISRTRHNQDHEGFTYVGNYDINERPDEKAAAPRVS